MSAVAEALAGVVAHSPAMRELLALVARAADARSSVLLRGESGTGKDLVAMLLHCQGARRDGPFIRVHCPSIPAELVESDLFGHERGAFTDALQTKLGKLELAAGGTLYLDQVQDLQPALQAKLLRVVEERRFERLGGTRTLEVDVRFVASASGAPGLGALREDLYHRLSVLPLELPPLRARREDVLPLAQLFLARERERGTTRAAGFTEEAEAALVGYRWPGNVRELRAAVERAALTSDAAPLPLSALPQALIEEPRALWEGRERRPSLKQVEQAYIRHVLEQVAFNQTRAARVLGISRKALWEKRRRYGIR